MAKVLALIERDEREGMERGRTRANTVRRSACALLTLARRLGEPVAVVGGAPPDAEMIRTLGRYGATEIWYLDGARSGKRDDSAAGPTVARQGGRGGDLDDSAADSAAALPRPRGFAGSALAGGGSMAELAAEPVGLIAGGANAEAVAASETDLLVALANRLTPAAILIASTHRGQETAARLAIRLDSGIITDAVDLVPGPDGEPLAIQHCLAGAYLVESSVIRGVPVFTVRPEAAVPEPHPAEPALHAIVVEPAETRAPRIAVSSKPRADHPALDHADIVVAGGRGVGSRAAFAVLAEVAGALGAAVAGSHTAAELGWIPPEARVGLTGKTIHPRLYLACGVSGSVRHRAGMQGAKTVVAIGDDPNAPIFKLADLGIVGDAPAILPALLAEIQNRTRLGARTRAESSQTTAADPDPIL